MKLKLTLNPYPYINNLITKIVYLTRMMTISEGDVILVKGTKNLKFVVFVSSLLAGRHLFFGENNDDIRTIRYNERIGTILYDGFHDYDNYLTSDLTAIIINSCLFNMDRNFHFLYVHSWTRRHEVEYRSLESSSFKDERKAFNKLFEWRVSSRSKNTMTISNNTKDYIYTNTNIVNMLNVVDSEFKDKKRSLVRFSELSFEKGFVYMLYFFLRGDLVELHDTSIVYHTALNTDRKLEEIVFFENNTFNKNFHKHLKYVIYSKTNLFFNRWWITRWITKFTYDYGLRGKLINRNNYELVIINKERSLDKSQFLDHTKTRTSTIHGTPADGYTLSINRYNDKKLNVTNNSFRIMDSKNSIKLQTDAINKLYISGARIAPNVMTSRAIQSKNKLDFYYLCDDYYELNGEILTVKADLIDIYYDLEGNIATDIGTRKRSLMAIPYIKQVDVFKLIDKIIAVVELDIDFIERKFELPRLSTVISHLNNKIKELNYELHNSQKIDEAFVLRKFFDEFDRVKHTITKENFIELLNQQPSNYLERFFKEGNLMLDEVV